MAFYGKWETWKIVYILAHNKVNDALPGAVRGVALVEAGDRAHALHVFNELYSGQYHTVESCEKLNGGD